MLSKRQQAIQTMQTHEQMLQCPLCKEVMTVAETGAVQCLNRHSYDIAKQGYVYLLTKPMQSMYSKELFEARHDVIASGLYDEVQQKVAKLLPKGRVLDTGCGEGSHLVRMLESRPDCTGIGIDIAKEAIVAAAKFATGPIWCVGDLANSPFAAGSFSSILNFLSPANYDEFKRLLQPDGIVIKVVPEEGYLKELRAQAFANSKKETYSNDQTVQRFEENFQQVEKYRVTYSVPLQASLVPKLLQMTPMGWHIDNKENVQLPHITIDVSILVGRV
ncbi:MAG: putative RNA methyltransferase [Lysinibacillus sp.]